MKTINSAVDRLLARLLRGDTAGACVPDHGDSCGATKYVCHLGRLYKTVYGRVQCNGSCPNPVTTNAGTC
ncbi:hypothetical protein [Virgisporangium aurantiacum]|uniref:Uncharacterized protein n=1 Tax=Virgisporangium aurantiacum TaxID=175570 RepID=A0A8J4E1U1_9ACTN|nr:hypothetical protein [Virgisporangium aurantiacum]GIJ56337.1 hypothetical protein Vau01_038530 [Virgisporangium aurantiacum]